MAFLDFYRRYTLLEEMRGGCTKRGGSEGETGQACGHRDFPQAHVLGENNYWPLPLAIGHTKGTY